MKPEEKLVSIVVPVYNVEPYIRDCVDSILGQYYKNFELILVDDGSTDISGQICDEYASQDSRIKVIHKENGGLSDARNVGTDAAVGDYLTYIDSDDLVSSDYLEIMIDAAQQYDADIVQCGNTRSYEEFEDGDQDEDPVVFKGGRILHEYLRFRIPKVFAWGKLIRKELMRNVRFPVGIIDEDNFTTYKWMARAKTFVFIDKPCYYYRVNPESITQIKFHEKRFGIYECPDQIRSFLGKRAQKYDRDLKYYKMRLGVQLFNQAIKAGKEKEFEDRLEEIRDDLSSVSAKEIGEQPSYTIMRNMIIHKNPLYYNVIRKYKKTYV